jgi:hypothetical protein
MTTIIVSLRFLTYEVTNVPSFVPSAPRKSEMPRRWWFEWPQALSMAIQRRQINLARIKTIERQQLSSFKFVIGFMQVIQSSVK